MARRCARGRPAARHSLRCQPVAADAGAWMVHRIAVRAAEKDHSGARRAVDAQPCQLFQQATVGGLESLEGLLGVGYAVSDVTQFLDQTPLACQGFFTFRRGCLEKLYSACEFAIHARCNATGAHKVP
jgi:hypothetical protein